MTIIDSLKACIFDFDGILVESEPIFNRAWIKAASEYGYQIDESFFIQCYGLSLTDIKQIYFDRLGNDFPFGQIVEKVNAFFDEEIKAHGLPVRENALDVKSFFTQRGFKVAVASSTHIESLKTRLRKIKQLHEFPVIVGGDEVSRSKPDPEIFLKAASLLKVEPQECLVLEDSENGTVAAKRAGMLVFIVKDLAPITARSRQHADAIFSSHGELLDFLKSKKHRQ
ncbi:MAG: HAD family phosphatase [Chloroflexota bacterium]